MIFVKKRRMIHSQNITTPAEYGLTLSDGTCWQLSGADDLISWAERWAAIMELKASERSGSPKLIFSSTTGTQSV
jgi:trehalose-6-phosphatase